VRGGPPACAEADGRIPVPSPGWGGARAGLWVKVRGGKGLEERCFGLGGDVAPTPHLDFGGGWSEGAIAGVLGFKERAEPLFCRFLGGYQSGTAVPVP